MKKALSLFLVFVLSVCLFTPAFAEFDGKCDCGFSPIIYVGPLGCASIVRDAGQSSEQTLWKIDTGFLVSNLAKILPDTGKALVKKDTALLGDKLIEFIWDTFGDLALDGDGKSKENVTTPDLNVPEGSRHGIDSDYYFNYDFRLDPFTHAERLHEFIAEVKELTGHDSVKLKCSSMGGVVLSAYLEKYGCDGIDVIICRCCPLWGTAVAGELFNGKLELNAEALRRYGEDAIPFMETGFADDFVEGTLYAVLQALKYSGILDKIISLGNGVLEDIGDRLFDEALIPIFGTFLGIWAFVPEEYYNGALEFMKVPTDGDLYRQIASYRTAQKNISANLTKARKNGVNVCITCGYNVQRTPLVSLWKSTSDGTVDTKYASLGATCCNTKETLSEEYLSSLENTAYLSPDKMIDASTCELKDCTWFFRDWLHCNGNPAIDEFYNLVMTSEEPVNINSFEDYPQFMKIDDNANTLTPVTENENFGNTFKNSPSYLNFIRFIFELLGKILNITFK